MMKLLNTLIKELIRYVQSSKLDKVDKVRIIKKIEFIQEEIIIYLGIR